LGTEAIFGKKGHSEILVVNPPRPSTTMSTDGPPEPTNHLFHVPLCSTNHIYSELISNCVQPVKSASIVLGNGIQNVQISQCVLH